MPEEVYCNKVIINGETKIDISQDTVDPDVLLSGYTAHDASGAPIEGNLVVNDDHNNLRNRDAEDSHPVSAITGLSEVLEDVDEHIRNENIHVTNYDKDAWDAKYNKPDSGIPKSDLSEDVSESLEKADSALQEVPSTYRTSAEQDAIDDGKQPLINDLATIRSGAALGSTAVQPEEGKGLFSGDYNDLSNKPDIPDDLADLSDDATHRLVTDTEKSIWNGKQDAISDLSTIRSGATLGATAVQPVAGKGLSTNDYTNEEKNKLAGLENYDDTDIVNDLAEINSKIPSAASSINKLVSQSEMGEAISLVEAKQLYKTALQGSFETRAELVSATTFYNADGTIATPTKNDVAYVLSDETREGKSSKYVIAAVSEGTITWGFVITFSDNIFTQAQMSSINSGMTANLREAYSNHVSNSEIHVTSENKTSWNAKENAGKITVNGVERLARVHTVSIVTNGVTTNFDLVGVQ